MASNWAASPVPPCEERFGRELRCLTLRYSLLLSVWVVDPVTDERKTKRKEKKRKKALFKQNPGIPIVRALALGRFFPPRPTALFLDSSFAGGVQAMTPITPTHHPTTEGMTPQRTTYQPHCRTDPISKTSSSGSNWHWPSRHRYTARGHDCWPCTLFVVILHRCRRYSLFILMVDRICWPRFTVETARAPGSTRWPHW